MRTVCAEDGKSRQHLPACARFSLMALAAPFHAVASESMHRPLGSEPVSQLATLHSAAPGRTS